VVESKDISSPLSRHLEELRNYMLLPFIINTIILILIISFASKLILELLETVDLNINNLSSYSPTEYFKTKIYVSLMLSLVFTTPLWLISLYNFSAPGLTEKEKTNVKFSLILGFFFFLLGCIIGFYYIVPRLLEFFLMENEMVVENLSIYETIKIIISTSLFTGILVSTPVVTLLLDRIVKEKKDIRKYIYTLILLIAIIATPKPSMIINLIFLLTLTLFAEITLFITGRFNGN
jgi:sec-independent protein translocase protein TatC